MLASPFGEKFHFRTALPLVECERRIDTLTSEVGEGNYSNFPVSRRKKGRFTLWENAVLQPPRVIGRLTYNMGWTEISGRGGANLTSLWSALGVFALFASLGIYNAVYEGGSIGPWSTVAFAVIGSMYIYWRQWEDPNAGALIDYLQQLLEAEPLPSQSAKSAIR